MPKNTQIVKRKSKGDLASPIGINLPQGAVKEAGDSIVKIQQQAVDILGPTFHIVRNVALLSIAGGVAFFGVKLYLKNKAQSDIYNKMIAGDKEAEAAISFAILLEKNIIQKALDTITGGVKSAMDSVINSIFLSPILGPASDVSSLFQGQGLGELAQKLVYIAANIHSNNISVDAVQTYFYKYTGGRLLITKINTTLKKKESSVFFDYLRGVKKLTVKEAEIKPTTGDLPTVGQAAIVGNIEGKIVVFNKS